MPAESLVFVTVVVVMFATFVIALAWGERQTRVGYGRPSGKV